MQKNIAGLYFKLYTKINSKWIQDLNVRAKTIQLLEENVEMNLCDLWFGKGFLEVTSKKWETNNTSIALHQNYKL